MADPVTGYWFAQASADGQVHLANDDGRLVRVGESLSVAPPIILCTRGLHASRSIFDALRYAPGPVLAVVRLEGTIIEDTDKCAAETRTVLWMEDVSKVLHLAACDFAERALIREEEAGRPVDPRSWDAIQVTRAWIRGDTTEGAWTAVRAAARAAARDAAWDARAAARAAAWDARAAAWAAAEAAAWAAARAAAWTAAEAAAEAANRGAAARDAEPAWQEMHLREMLHQAGMPAIPNP